MNALFRLLKLDFLPQNTDLALLVLRLWLGISMFILHGMDKFKGFAKLSESFPDPLGIGSPLSLVMAILAEFVGSAMLAVGAFTRLAALLGLVTMAVAAFVIHDASFSGPKNGELALIYLGGYMALFIAGGGRFALDQRIH